MKQRKRLIGACLACALALLPLAATAQDEVGSTTDPSVEIKPGKIFDLAVCVVSIATIETGAGAAFAVISCSRAAAMWWSE